jgi:hypothetical protein
MPAFPFCGNEHYTDPNPAFLFRCGNSNLCAITRDEAGNNLPKHECEDGWRLSQGFALSVEGPVPASVDPQKVITALSTRAASTSGTT